MNTQVQVQVPKAINKKVLFVVGKITRYLIRQGKGFSVSFNDDATVEEEEGFKRIEGSSISIELNDPVGYDEVADFLEKLGFVAVNGVSNKIVSYIAYEEESFQEEWERTVLEREYGGGRRKVIRIMVILKGVTVNEKSSVDHVIIYPKILIWR